MPDEFTVNDVDDDVKPKEDNAVRVSLCILRRPPISDLDLKGQHCFFLFAITTGGQHDVHAKSCCSSISSEVRENV